MFFTVGVSVTIGVGLRAGCCRREYREMLPLPGIVDTVEIVIIRPRGNLHEAV